MSNPAVESLKDVLGRYGPSVCQTPRMCEMMIRNSGQAMAMSSSWIGLAYFSGPAR